MRMVNLAIGICLYILISLLQKLIHVLIPPCSVLWFIFVPYVSWLLNMKSRILRPKNETNDKNREIIF